MASSPSLTMAHIRDICRVDTNEALKTKVENGLWYAQTLRTATFISGAGIAAGACLSAIPFIGMIGVITGLSMMAFAHTADQFMQTARALTGVVSYLVDENIPDHTSLLSHHELFMPLQSIKQGYEQAQASAYLPVPDMDKLPILKDLMNNLPQIPMPAAHPGFSVNDLMEAAAASASAGRPTSGYQPWAYGQ